MKTLVAATRPRHSVILLLAVFVCVTQPANAYQNSAPASTVSGQVINGITGAPIARALVQIGSQHATLTDHEGRFEFDSVREVSPLVVSKPGYYPEIPFSISTGVVQEESTLNPSNASESKPVILKLVPEAILFGKVTDPNDEPLQDLRVDLKMLQVSNGLRRWQPVRSTKTNAEGEFRFAELAAGKYSLATEVHIDGPENVASSVAFMPVSYPPRESEQSQKALTLGPGDHAEADLSPPAGRLFPVTGKVDAPPARGYAVAVETSDGEPVNVPVRVYPQTGEFRGLLPSGNYRLTVSAYMVPQQVTGTREIAVAEGPLSGISIPLQQESILPVEVEFQRVETASQDAESVTPSSVPVSLVEMDPAKPAQVLYAQDPGGDRRNQQPGDPLTISNVAPGRYELQVQPQPPWHVSSATCGNIDVLRDALAITDSAAGCTIRIMFRNDSASLNWSVLAGGGEAETQPVYVSAIPLENLAQSAVTEGAQPPHGTFHGLAPGRYLVIAFRHPQELPYRDHEAMQPYLSLGQEVTLAPNDQAEVQLQVVAEEP